LLVVILMTTYKKKGGMEYNPRKHKQGATTSKWGPKLPYKKNRKIGGSCKWGVGTWSNNVGE
jgi:hypothetical protein